MTQACANLIPPGHAVFVHVVAVREGSLQQPQLRPPLRPDRSPCPWTGGRLRGRRVRLCLDGSFAGHARRAWSPACWRKQIRPSDVPKAQRGLGTFTLRWLFDPTPFAHGRMTTSSTA